MMISFAQPYALSALLLVPLAAVFLWWADRRRTADLRRLGHPAAIERLTTRIDLRGRRRRRWLWMGTVALLIVAAARPQWGETVREFEQEGIQVMIALDVSASMLATDPAPSRLARAKLNMTDLMSRLNGDEVGLVLFSGAAFIQFPLTADYDTARAFLQTAGPHSISQPGTAVAAAIRTAQTGFDTQRDSQKVILLLTDGENHLDDPVAAAAEAAAENILIYAVGFGSPDGEPIPEYDDAGTLTGYKLDDTGTPVLSRLDEETLAGTAEAGGGRYWRAQSDGGEMDALTAELGRLQTDVLRTRREVNRIERFPWLAATAVVLLITAAFLPDMRPAEAHE